MFYDRKTLSESSQRTSKLPVTVIVALSSSVQCLSALHERPLDHQCSLCVESVVREALAMPFGRCRPAGVVVLVEEPAERRTSLGHKSIACELT